MLEPLLEERQHVLVVECVVDQPAVAAGADNAGIAQQTELVRDGRLGDVQPTGEIADAQFAARERVENAHARRITEYTKDLGQPLDGLLIETRPGSMYLSHISTRQDVPPNSRQPSEALPSAGRSN